MCPFRVDQSKPVKTAIVSLLVMVVVDTVILLHLFIQIVLEWVVQVDGFYLNRMKNGMRIHLGLFSMMMKVKSV